MDEESRRLYKRYKMRQYRSRAFMIISRSHHKSFKVTVQAMLEGRCPYCQILLSSMPFHDCLSLDIQEDQITELIHSLFPQEELR